jgi:hypothetical protein
MIIIDSTSSKKTLKTLTSSNSDEHNTPSYLIEAAREIMGGIDLVANETIKATDIYTKEDDGLTKNWYGRVWLNPPFSLSKLAIPKLIESYENGNVKKAVILIKSDVSTQKYKLLYPYPFCELNRRVKFENTSNKDSSPFPVVMFYLGQDFYKWNQVMSKLGKVHIGHRLFSKLAMRCNVEDLKNLGIISNNE